MVGSNVPGPDTLGGHLLRGLLQARQCFFAQLHVLWLVSVTSILRAQDLEESIPNLQEVTPGNGRLLAALLLQDEAVGLQGAV